MRPAVDYTVYLVTDRDLMSTETLEEAVEAACRGGATLVQLREKHCSRDEFLRIARSIKEITDRHDVGLIINDAADIAAEIGALGVHVGQSDMNAREVRAIVGPDAVIGVSASTVEQALAAQADGADYLGVGAMSFTATKPEADITTMDELARILDAVDIPCVVIGGINAQTIPHFAGMPLAGYAIVSGIISQPDIEQAARDIARIARA